MIFGWFKKSVAEDKKKRLSRAVELMQPPIAQDDHRRALDRRANGVYLFDDIRLAYGYFMQVTYDGMPLRDQFGWPVGHPDSPAAL